MRKRKSGKLTIEEKLENVVRSMERIKGKFGLRAYDMLEFSRNASRAVNLIDDNSDSNFREYKDRIDKVYQDASDDLDNPLDFNPEVKKIMTELRHKGKLTRIEGPREFISQGESRTIGDPVPSDYHIESNRKYD